MKEIIFEKLTIKKKAEEKIKWRSDKGRELGEIKTDENSGETDYSTERLHIAEECRMPDPVLTTVP